MFASGGRCAMTDCGLSLLSPSGGWVGTVAHIVAAEPGGPRGAESMSPEERRGFVEEAKASGLVARFIEHHKVRGLSVAPAA